MDLAEGNVSTICERQPLKNEVEVFLLSFQWGFLKRGYGSNQAGSCSMSVTSEYMERNSIRCNLLFVLDIV